MEQFKEVVSSALRFTPERMEPLISDVYFAPVFALDDGFVYVKEDFNGEKKIKRFMVYRASDNSMTELFDHREFSAAYAKASGEEPDPDALDIVIKRVESSGAVIFLSDDGTKYIYENGEVKQICPSLPDGAVVSPDGTRAVTEEGGNLYLYELPSMTKTRLTEDGRADSGYGIRYPGSSGFIADMLKGRKNPAGIEWSPDGNRFLTYYMDFSAVEDYTLIQSVPEGPRPVRPRVYRYKYALPGDKHVPTAVYYVYDIAERKLTRLDATATFLSFGMPISGRASMAGWSMEGNIAACYSMNRDFTKADIFILDPASGKGKKLFTESADTFLFFDGHRRLNSGDPTTEEFGGKTFVISEKLGKLYWLSERSGQFDIYEYDLESGEDRKLTQSDCCVRQILHLDDEKGILYYSASGREAKVNIYQRYVYCVDLQDGRIERLSRENGDHNAFFPPEGDYFVASISAYDEPPTNRVFNITDGTLKAVISEADVTRLEELGFTYPIPFCEKGADDVDVFGLIFLPNRFDPTRKYPVIEYCYGGNQTTRAPQNFAETLNDLGFTPVFSDAGFVTVILDGRGTPLRGKEWHDYGYNNMGDCAGLKDRSTAIKNICKRFQFMDADRVGVWGHSGGGFATLHAMVDYPELYKVGVSTGGNHSQEIYSSNWSERYMGKFDEKVWEAQNAEYNVDKLEGKILFIHGELDDNVHPASTMRVVDALIKADKDFDMLIMPNMHHTMREHDYYRRKVLEFFLENL